MDIILIGIVTAFNFIVIKWKLEHDRALDASLDLTILIVVGWIFSGSTAGMTIAMTASGLFSLYLLVSPPKFMEDIAPSKGQKDQKLRDSMDPIEWSIYCATRDAKGKEK